MAFTINSTIRPNSSVARVFRTIFQCVNSITFRSNYVTIPDK